MTLKINTINLENLDLLDRDVENIEQVQSIRVHPINGTFFACFPIAEIAEEDFTGME